MGLTPKISVIIPVYNAEKYLSRCIDSVLNQTCQDFELILVNDGSSDLSPKICDDYAQKDSRVKVIHKENCGVSSARNTGLEVVLGEYTTFVDSDDYIDADFFDYAYLKSQESDADIFVSGLVMEKWAQNNIVERSFYKIETAKNYFSKELLEDWGQKFPAICMCGPCCKFYKTSIIKNNFIYFDKSLSCGEDTYFNLHVLENISKIYFSEKIFYHYRRENEFSLYSRFHKDTYEIHNKVYGKMRKLMIDLHCNIKSIKKFENYYFCLMLGGIHEYFRFYNQNTKDDKLNLIKKIALDKNVQKNRVLNITGYKNKILFLLLKFRKYKAILKIFEKHYQR